jgi:hypothetical protein
MFVFDADVIICDTDVLKIQPGYYDSNQKPSFEGDNPLYAPFKIVLNRRFRSSECQLFMFYT